MINKYLCSSFWPWRHAFISYEVSDRSKSNILVFNRIVIIPLTHLTLSLKNIRIVSFHLTPLASFRLWIWINITIAAIYILIARIWSDPLWIIRLIFSEKVIFSLSILIDLVSEFKGLFKVILIGYVYRVSQSKLFWVFQLFWFLIALPQRLWVIALCNHYTIDTVASAHLAKLHTIFIH